ncbi:pYEATS domain-containing protein [Caulobacter sp. 1776]|uniref:pYEATS domain-containing protein n=1 Tax=Caulobacter sp. 1776 TaxID=3156420 RepID=UPI00339476D0
MLQWLAHWFVGFEEQGRGQARRAVGHSRASPTILALVVLFSMAALGVLALFIAAWIVMPVAGARHHVYFNGRFMAFGLLAGSAGAAGGGLLGLLFGLPTSAARAVAQSNASANDASQANPWFNDNTAMEQIADWLTKIIVGLSLANFGTFLTYGWQVCVETSKAMTGVASSNPAIGGLTLAPAALIGFSISYIWIRRYLPGELANARLDMIERQRESHEIISGLMQIRAADAAGDKQEQPGASKRDSTERLAEQIAQAAGDEGPFELVRPGTVMNDPWKGQFANSTVSTRSASLLASVKPIPGDKNWFTVAIRVAPLKDASALAGMRARLYLHSSFKNPVREIVLNKNGAYALDLVAWGAFTIGLQLQTGELHELDLAELPDAPEVFRSR